MRTYSVILLTLLLVSGPVFAGQASQASTNSGETGIFNIFTADTLDKGKWSFGVFGENIDREDKNLDINNFSFAFAYGVSDRVELAGSWNFLTRTKFNQIGEEVTNNDVPIAVNTWNQGVGDFQVGGKVNLMREDEGSPVGLAVRAFLKFPTADDRKSLGTGAASGGGDLVVSKNLGTCSVLAFNAGVVVNGDNEEIKILNTARVGAGVDVHLAGGLHAIAELRALPLLGNGDEDRSTPVDLSAGFEYELSNGMSFGAMYRNNVAWDAYSNATKQGAVGFIRFGTPSECVAPPPPPPPPPEPTPPPPPPPAPEPPKPPEVTPVQPKMPPADVVLTDVHFKFDRYELTEEAQGIIKDAAKFLQEYPDINCQIEGHCCSIGTEEYNMALGQRRADAVRNYLISAFNLDANRLTTISYGESKPMYDNSKESTRKLNRRGHFNILIQ